MSADSDVSPQASYIQHHLVHYNNIGEKQGLIADFGVINYDSIFWSILTGVVAVLVMWLAARAALPGNIKKISSTYHIPISNTAAGIMLLENS